MLLQELLDKYSCFIFDLDGTLLDSMDLWNQVDEEFLGRRGFKVTEEYTNFVKSHNLEEGAIYTISKYNLSESPKQVIDEWNSMVSDAYHSEVLLKAGAMDVISTLKSHKKTIACATSLGLDNASAVLKANNIYDLFSAIITPESFDRPIDKKTPRIYVKTSDSVGINPSDCIVFEDVLVALRSARSGGFGTCAVFDKIGCGKCDWPQMEAESDYAIRSWQDLLQ